MPAYSKAEVKAKLDVLDAEIALTEPDQAHVAGGAGQGAQLHRGDLGAKYRERQFWMKEYERLELMEQGGGVRLAVFSNHGGRR